MRRLRRQLSKLTGRFLDLPQDVILDLPRITLIGNMQTYIENHQGVTHFSDELLKLNLSKGRLQIHGKNLVIRAIFSDEVFIEGIVEEVKYFDV
ncbi:sporulation protein YqfC [Ferviditalea candida]|uniref:Sporulation protein YqfC n=1 Tax=Ferviditalea candida TaxID=3108399 RepID=A0ABU5ZDV1_9BACL|nr:sporulation protein YqfC [Paenibacillaceae bacterium T2]